MGLDLITSEPVFNKMERRSCLLYCYYVITSLDKLGTLSPISWSMVNTEIMIRVMRNRCQINFTAQNRFCSVFLTRFLHHILLQVLIVTLSLTA